MFMKMCWASRQSAVRSSAGKSRAMQLLFLFASALAVFGVPVILGGVDTQNNRILVKPLAGLDLSALHVLLGTTVLNTFPAIGNLQIVQLPIGASLDNMLALFRRSGLVQYAEPDFQVQAL